MQAQAAQGVEAAQAVEAAVEAAQAQAVAQVQAAPPLIRPALVDGRRACISITCLLKCGKHQPHALHNQCSACCLQRHRDERQVQNCTTEY